MHIHLWEWNANTVIIEFFLNILVHVEVHIPVVLRLTPRTHGEVHRAIAQFGNKNINRLIVVDVRTSIGHFLDDLPEPYRCHPSSRYQKSSAPCAHLERSGSRWAAGDGAIGNDDDPIIQRSQNGCKNLNLFDGPEYPCDTMKSPTLNGRKINIKIPAAI
jgi:hypothetical protein